nr:MAG TPA: hypothetical protein [Caudoviricetes sp.]
MCYNNHNNLILKSSFMHEKEPRPFSNYSREPFSKA